MAKLNHRCFCYVTAAMLVPWITGPYRLSVTSRLLFLQITMRAARVRNNCWIRVGLAVIAPKIQWIDQ